MQPKKIFNLLSFKKLNILYYEDMYLFTLWFHNFLVNIALSLSSLLIITDETSDAAFMFIFPLIVRDMLSPCLPSKMDFWLVKKKKKYS